MPTLLRKRNSCKHCRMVQLTVAEQARVLASGLGFTREELGRPMHDSRIAQLQEALGRVQRLPPVQAPAPAPKPAPKVLRPVGQPALPSPAPVSESIASSVDLQVYYRLWPGELTDKELVALPLKRRRW